MYHVKKIFGFIKPIRQRKKLCSSLALAKGIRFDSLLEQYRESFQSCDNYVDFWKVFTELQREQVCSNLVLSDLLVNSKLGPSALVKSIRQELVKHSSNPKLEIINFYKTFSYMSASSDWMEVLASSNGDPTSDSLSFFYNNNQLVGHAYTRLMNKKWITARLLPFMFIPSFLLEGVYLEDGGADGLLPIFAATMFNKSVNAEPAMRQRDFCFSFAHKVLRKSNLECIESIDEVDDGSVSTLSSHQVLEHVLDVEEHLRLYHSKLCSSGVLILSTGFHVHPHPGHLPSSIKFAGREKELVERNGFARFSFTDILYAFTGNLVYQKV